MIQFQADFDKLLIRQGFACFISGYGDFHPSSLNATHPRGFLTQRQIFRWPTAVAEDGSESVGTCFYVCV